MSSLIATTKLPYATIPKVGRRLLCEWEKSIIGNSSFVAEFDVVSDSHAVLSANGKQVEFGYFSSDLDVIECVSLKRMEPILCGDVKCFPR